MSKRILSDKRFGAITQYLSPQDAAWKLCKLLILAIEPGIEPVIFWFPLRLICVTDARSATSAGMVPLRLFCDQTPARPMAVPTVVT